MADDPRVQSILDKLLDSDCTPEEACGDCLELLPIVQERWQRGQALAAEVNELFPSPWSTVVGAGAPPTPDELPQVPGYAVQALLGRGGMGIVLRVHEPELNRHLALKVLTAGRERDPQLVQRFLDEAQITGQLQHPGIAPIHSLGKLPNGRPYFTMKLIKGRTLAQLLHERPAPAAELPHFLAIFEQLCQTLAYAHSRRVLHRDLKPANVMVGAFGEVQLMDWGLAKVLAEQPTAAAAPAAPAASVIETAAPTTADSATQAGWILGTLAYMPPEQARGELERVGKPSDVFGLGAILCEILTGQPPYCGTPGEVKAQAQCGQLQSALARLEQSGQDAALVTLAVRCLSVRTEDRPADAGEVAAAVRSYRDAVQQRLRSAELERAAALARAHAEQRRREAVEARTRAERGRRRTTVALAASLLVLLAGISAALLWYQAGQVAAAGKLAATEQALRQSLTQAEDAHRKLDEGLRQAGGVQAHLNQPGRWEMQLRTARADWQRARDLADQAEGSVDSALTDLLLHLDRELTRAQDDYALAVRFEKIRLDKARSAEGNFDFARAAREYPQAFQDASLPMTPGRQHEAAALIGQSAIKEQLLAAVDDWAWIARFIAKDQELASRLAAVARLADPHPWRDQVRNPARWEDGAALRQLAEQLRAEPKRLALLSPHLLVVIGLLLPPADQEPWLRAAQALHPADFWINNNLGSALHYDKDRSVEAAGFFRVALALRPNNEAVYNNLGNALLAHQDVPGAVDAYERALAIDPNYLWAWNNLGRALAAQKRLPAAIAAYKKALEIDPNYVHAWNNLGNALRSQGNLTAAIDAYQNALAIDGHHVNAWNGLGNALRSQGNLTAAIDAYHKALDVDGKYAPAWNNLGVARREQNNPSAALAAYRKALDLDGKYAPAWNNLGVVLREQHDLPGAIDAYQKALAIDPKDSAAWHNLGNALRERKDLPGASAAYKKAVDIDSQHASAWNSLGVALREQKDLPGAIAAYQKALDRDPQFAYAWYNLGNARRDQNDLLAATDAYRRAIASNAQLSTAWNGLGVVLTTQRKLPAAIDAFKKALHLDPKDARVWSNLGKAQYEHKELPAAIDAYQEAVAIDPKNAATWRSLAVALRDQQDLPGAIAAYQKSLAIAPKQASAWHNLGNALREQNDVPGAIDAYRKALAIDSRLVATWGNLGIALAAAKDRQGSIDATRKALALDPSDARAWNNLGISLLEERELPEAIAAFRKALALDPRKANSWRCLGEALRDLGDFGDAVVATRRALQLLPKDQAARPGVERQLDQCRQLVVLKQRLPQALQGEKHSPAEDLALAEMCQRYLKRYRDAAALFARAFAAEPSRAEELDKSYRYNAACAAAVAAGGSGAGADQLDAHGKHGLRQQALTWLQADLKARAMLLEKDAQAAARIREDLQQWRRDRDLAGVREPEPLGKLPADERAGWERLWTEVDRLAGTG